MIDRLSAQQLHLDDAAAQISGVTGPVLEIGLGKGRTYDHLRKRFPDRDIFVFDGSVHAPAEVVPPADRLIIGDFRETLAATVGTLAPAALIHADLGSDDRAADAALAASIAPVLPHLLAADGLLLSDREMADWALQRLSALDTPWPYYRYRLA